MSEPGILSQAEIDALMQGMAGADPPPGGESSLAGGAMGGLGAFGGHDVQPGEPVAFDWQSLPRLTRSQTPALEVINQRLLRGLRNGFFALWGRHVQIAGQTVLTRRYSDFLDETAVPSGCAVVNLRPLAGQGLLLCDAALADVVVDLLYGGSGKMPQAPDARCFASMGLQAVQRLLGMAMAATSQAWSGVGGLTFELDRLETDVRQAHVATALERLYVSVFLVQIGDVLGRLTVALPWASLAPIRDVLESPTWGDFVQQDRRWLTALTHEVRALEVSVYARCAPVDTDLAGLLALRAGDFIELGEQPQILATLEGLPLFEGRLKTQSGHQAIRIERDLTAANEAGAV